MIKRSCYNNTTKFDSIPSVSSLPLLLTPISHSSPIFLSKFKPIFPLTSSSSSLFSSPTPLPRKLPSATMLHHDPLVSDFVATAISGAVAVSCLRVWQETAKRGLFDQKLNRKLVHISIGLVFMLCWPLFSNDRWASFYAALVPGVNIFRMLVTGLGIYKDDATVKSMSRFGDYRELLRGPLYYAATITFASIIYWRTSPVSIAAICNLCAGDGLMDKRKVPINIVFIGHANSGKSTTAGHLICKLGGLEKDVIEKVEKEATEMNKPSYKYAWVLDKLKAERERGITTDISLSKFETFWFKCTVIDTPGHKDYITNMMAGASQADCAVLVIDSTTTGFEASVNDPTCEPALLAFTLGVDQIICCCNKMDATTPKYSFNRFSKIKQQVLPFLSRVGYNPHQIHFVPISSFDGDNLIEPSTKFDWYNGPTLLQAIDFMKAPKRPLDQPLRLPIQGVYNIGGIGVMPVGRVETGCLRPGMFVTFASTGLQAKVTSLVMHPGIFSTGLQAEANSLDMNHVTLPAAHPGDIVGFNVDVPDMDIKQGDVASDPKNDPAMEAAHFTSHVIITNHPRKIEKGYEAILHCQNSHTTVKFEELIYKIDNHSGEVIEKWPQLLVSGDAAVIKMIPTSPLVVEPFTLCPPLGRFVVRDLGQTVAVGVVKSVTCKITESALEKN